MGNVNNRSTRKIKIHPLTYPDADKYVQKNSHNRYPLASPTFVDQDSPSAASAQIHSPGSDIKTGGVIRVSADVWIINSIQKL